MLSRRGVDSTMYVEKYHLEKGEGIRRDDKEIMATKGSHSRGSTSEKEGRACPQQSHDRGGLNSMKGVIDSHR
jgi:hypothetical protein